MSGVDFRLITAALDGLSLRHRVTSANLANQSTPGYRRREVTFEDQLERAAHGGTFEPRIREDRTKGDGDGNNVDPDQENAELNCIEIQFQTLTQALSAQASLMRSAITGRG